MVLLQSSYTEQTQTYKDKNVSQIIKPCWNYIHLVKLVIYVQTLTLQITSDILVIWVITFNGLFFLLLFFLLQLKPLHPKGNENDYFKNKCIIKKRANQHDKTVQISNFKFCYSRETLLFVRACFLFFLFWLL